MRAVKRLNAIASLIECEDKVADIGSDHGYLCKLLIESKKAKEVIATDISEKSLQKTINLSKRYGLENKIEVRVGDGMDVLASGEVNVVVIAGIGGYEIIKILERAKNKSFKNFIFQPAQNVVELRNYLINNNFEIIKDFIVKDQNKFYNTLQVRKASKKQQLSELEIKYGLTNFDLQSPDFQMYLKDRIERITKTLSENKSPKLEKELEELMGIYKGEINARNN